MAAGGSGAAPGMVLKRCGSLASDLRIRKSVLTRIVGKRAAEPRAFCASDNSREASTGRLVAAMAESRRSKHGEPALTKRSAGETEVPANTLDRVTFGKRLRAARKQFGWTLAQLAELSDISITTISRAERGQLALSYEKFSALGRALRMDMGAMFSEAGATARPFKDPVLTRAGEGVVYRGLSFSYEFLGTTAAGKQMSPILGTVHARHIDGPDDFVRHPGEEFVYVLTGIIDVHFDTGQVVQLRKGDSLYFDSSVGHAYVSVSRQLARVIGVTSSESTMLRLARNGKATASGAR
jgi:transcriptional regulator with XRE-family HTH domain